MLEGAGEKIEPKCGDASQSLFASVRERLERLGIDEADVADAMHWARMSGSVQAAE
jgi:hypothetical protein